MYVYIFIYSVYKVDYRERTARKTFVCLLSQKVCKHFISFVNMCFEIGRHYHLMGHRERINKVDLKR